MLGDHLPRYDAKEVHRVSSSAAPAALMDAARELGPREVPLLVALMAVRGLPALLRGRGLSPRGTILEIALRTGFVMLEDEPEELAVGAIGRFWHAAGRLRRIEPSEFRDFAEPAMRRRPSRFERRAATAGA